VSQNGLYPDNVQRKISKHDKTGNDFNNVQSCLICELPEHQVTIKNEDNGLEEPLLDEDIDTEEAEDAPRPVIMQVCLPAFGHKLYEEQVPFYR
jgi:hypothetical protein